MRQDSAEIDDGASDSSQSAFFNLVARRLCETFEIEISGEALRDLVSEIQDQMSGIGDLSDLSHEEPEDPAAPDVEDLVHELGKANIDIGDKHKFEAYWVSAVAAFEQEVVTKYLLSEARTMTAKWPGDEIPREAFDEIEQQLMQSTTRCFTFKILYKVFIHRVQHSHTVFRHAAKGLLKQLKVDEIFNTASPKKQPHTANLEELVMHLAERACSTLKKSASHDAKKHWQEARDAQAAREAAVRTCREPGLPSERAARVKQKKFRSSRVRMNTVQTYGSWMLSSSKDAVKQANTASYRLTHRVQA
ncbi:unnamed protein product [Symbiodinium natans]|uniref:Uncharacterized protein n=1 Tax=Symbiodinium natans TaxID=878477 RepID=A0A812P832_9DINO|nr:unnamed protein product [Symbiodinium natans]